MFGLARLPPIVQVGHHDAHAAIFFASPFEEATVLVMDGYGDETATSAYIGSGNRLEAPLAGELLRFARHALHLRHLSPGLRAVRGGHRDGARRVRRRHLRGEIPRPGPPRERAASSRSTGTICSHDSYGQIRPFKHKFLDTFGPPRRRDEPITDRHRDLAFALQATTEDVVLHVVRELAAPIPSRNLCLTGGVALNCVANARILRDTDYERVWVPPCASDTGAPFGSALWHHHQTLGRPRAFELTHPFYGTAYSDAEIAARLSSVASATGG